MLGPPIAYFILLIPEHVHPVNPIRAVVSSFIFVVLVGLINLDAGRTFIRTIQTTGPLILSFLAFNMFADAISLLETRWVLIKSQDVSLPILLLLLLVDLLLSGAIYLILPFFAGQDLAVFLQGIQFAGPRPWIGILFWSTFSTSAIFYLFVISALAVQVQKPIARALGRLGIALQFEEHPTFFISSVISLIVTVLFAALAIVRTVG